MRFQLYHQFKKTPPCCSAPSPPRFPTSNYPTSAERASYLRLPFFSMPNRVLTVQISHQNKHYIINTMNIPKTSPTSRPLHSLQTNYLDSFPRLQQQNIINMLALALTNSLYAYAFKCQPPTPRPPSNPCPPVAPHNVIEILSEDEEIPAIKLNNEPSQGFPKSSPVPKGSPTHPKTAELSPTSAEVPHESVPYSPNPAKKKKIKKGKTDRQQSEFQVEVPEVDLIETANLSLPGMARSETAKLSQALMRRRVFEWIYPVKKQKKQMRLLEQ